MEDAAILSSSKDARQGGRPTPNGPAVCLRGVAVMSSIEVRDEE
jgi:hypothetical protein